MSNCKVCGQPRSSFVMNNKAVCLKCDELLFDIEIECDDDTPQPVEKSAPATKSEKKSITPLKK